MEQVTNPGSRESLMNAAMAGDRDAMARIFEIHGDLIRGRLRRKLSCRTRSIFDSNDLLWSIAASVDRYITAGRLDVEREEQLWALIFRIGEREVARQSAISGRLPTCNLTSVGPGPVAAAPTQHELELPAINGLSDRDRGLLMLRGRGCSLALIAQLQGVTAPATRKRWERLCRRLRRVRPDGGR